MRYTVRFVTEPDGDEVGRTEVETTDGVLAQHLVDPLGPADPPVLGRWRLRSRDDDRHEAVYGPDER